MFRLSNTGYGWADTNIDFLNMSKLFGKVSKIVNEIEPVTILEYTLIAVPRYNLTFELVNTLPSDSVSTIKRNLKKL